MKHLTASAMLVILTACSPAQTDNEDNSAVLADESEGRHCLASADDTHSVVLNECIRPSEVGIELIHQGSGDRNYSAYALYDEDIAEVFIADQNKHLILKRDREQSLAYTWSSEETDMILVINTDDNLQLRDTTDFVMYAEDPVPFEAKYDEIPDHSYDDVGGDVLSAKGIVRSVEDGPYPQFTLYIDLEETSNPMRFNLIAEGADLNGADLGALDGKTVMLEYIDKETFDLIDLDLKGSERIENIEAQEGWFFAEGLLEGADEISNGDLPDTVTIWVNGGSVAFEAYIDPTLVKFNGKEVSAWFSVQRVNDIISLDVIE